MEKVKFEILTNELLKKYYENISDTFLKKYQQLQESELSIDIFSFYTSVSAVFSSKIEGEDIELDPFPFRMKV